MNTTTLDLPQESIRLLEVIKAMERHNPISITIEDMVELPKLIEELKEKERESENSFAEIQQIELEIQERQSKIQELKQSIDPRIRYLKESPITQAVKTVNHAIKEEYAGITEESVLKILKEDLPYGGGNSDIAKALSVENTKQIQQKIYSICHKLKDSGKVISENRMWKAV